MGPEGLEVAGTEHDVTEMQDRIVIPERIPDWDCENRSMNLEMEAVVRLSKDGVDKYCLAGKTADGRSYLVDKAADDIGTAVDVATAGLGEGKLILELEDHKKVDAAVSRADHRVLPRTLEWVHKFDLDGEVLDTL